MEPLKPFPLSTITHLTPDSITRLVSLRISTVQSLASRLAAGELEADSFRQYLGLTENEMNDIVEEIRSILPDNQTGLRPKFAMGALVPPGLEWQMGQTAGFISIANMLMRAETELKGLDSADESLLRDIDETLKWTGIRK
jgi:hypothetical protein